MLKAVIASVPFLVAVVLFVIVGRFGIGRIKDVRLRVAQLKKEQSVLGQKLSFLSDVTATVDSQSLISIAALPADNPSLIVASQLKILAAENGVLLGSIKGSDEIKESAGLSKVNLSFSVTGERSRLIAFIKRTVETAPIMVVEKIKLSDASGLSRAEIDIKSYWSGFPTKLPSLTESVKDLTEDERQTLSRLETLAQPQFIEVPPSQVTVRADPFAP